MGRKLYYELPDDNGIVAGVVDAIPSNWSWVDGTLGAPERLHERGRISENSVLLISRFYSIKPTLSVIKERDKDSGFYLPVERVGPKIKEIILDKKLPFRIRFDEAAFGTSKEITMDDVKEIARRFIEIGYKGHMGAFRDYHNNHKYDNSASFHFSQYGRDENKLFRTQGLPPFVELGWDERYSGRREYLDSIVEALERLGLKEIQSDYVEI